MHLQWDSDRSWVEVMDSEEILAIYFMRITDVDTYGEKLYATIGGVENWLCNVPEEDAEDLLVEAYRVHG